jgi:hypothetical protein
MSGDLAGVWGLGLVIVARDLSGQEEEGASTTPARRFTCMRDEASNEQDLRGM